MTSVQLSPLRARLAEAQEERALTRGQVEVAARPNVLVRLAFYASVFAIPFTELYLPGTGERIGVVRLVQGLILLAAISQPRVCVRFVPVALLWFGAYCGLRIAWGLWLTPELVRDWWPTTLQWLEFFLPWSWVMFNVLQSPNLSKRGLWVLVGGCALCALLHVAGIGTSEVGKGDEGRSSVFGQNANVIGTTYAVALIVLAAIGMLRQTNLKQRLLVIPLAGLIAIGLAKTGSRTGMMIVLTGMLMLLFQSRTSLPRFERYTSLALIAAVLAMVLYQMPVVIERLETLTSAELRPEEARARMFPVLWEIFLRSPIYAHNLLLLVLVETGVIGLIPVALAFKTALGAAWRARTKSLGWLPLALIVPLTLAGGP